MTPRILAITNEDPGWHEADKQQGDDAWQALVSGMAEEGYECRAFKFVDDLSFLDDFDPREWLVWTGRGFCRPCVPHPGPGLRRARSG